MIISKTPFRISFFGGGTDYPAWYRNHGGAALSCAIDKYCYISCRKLPPFFDHNYKIIYSKIEETKTLDQIQHPVIPAVVKYLGIEDGLEIHHDADLPARSGMGSSSSFVAGLLKALHAYKGNHVGTHRLLEESLEVEQGILAENVGSQDQTAVTYGGFNQLTFHPEGDIFVNPISLQDDRRQEFQSHLMLFFSGISRRSSEIAATFLPSIQEKAKQLHRMREMVEEAIAILSSQQDILEFGKLLHESWLLKRSLSHAISNDTCNDIYQAALDAGAVGGKILGAGGGGFMLFFAPPETHENIKTALSHLTHVPFSIDYSGSQIIHSSLHRG